MSRSTHNHHANTAHNGQTMLSKVRSEIAEHYVEVEANGTSLARLACIYIAGAREARLRMLHGLRSLFGLRPAH